MNIQPRGSFESAVVRLLRDDVDTDQIIPARFLTTTTRTGLGKCLFSDWRYDTQGAPRAEFALNAVDPSLTRVLVAGRNFGCGSSREHAPWALLDWGFRAVIATSFADIFRNNALKNGLLTVALSDESHAGLLRALDRCAAPEHGGPTALVRVNIVETTITVASEFSARFDIDPFARHCLLDGVDELGYLLAQSGAIEAFEAEMTPLVPTTGAPIAARSR